MQPKYAIGDTVFPVYWQNDSKRCLKCFGERVIVTSVGRSICPCQEQRLLVLTNEIVVPWWVTTNEGVQVDSIAVESGGLVYSARPYYRRPEALLFPSREDAVAFCRERNARIADVLGLDLGR